MNTPAKHLLKKETENHWRAIFNEWLASGKKIVIYCKEKKLSEASFFYWRNRLLPAYPKRSKPCEKRKETSKNRGFVPIKIEPPPMTALPEKMTLHYPNGCFLEIQGPLETLFLQLNQAMGVSDAVTPRR